ncbi:MAG: DNA repair protein RadC [Acidobacteria bacterium]|nr:DNA repair protein RadC [Acidobacteriota bacterium]NIO59594.1 DNA repair protein RadC [Acidobacteriota bacterium]NIQ30617.1 DNA repair protein RadC [Acidobacteriota bacterium]NIT11300.1 DNA repair protein RadC [Acidobacteriota bacterium]
MELAHALRPLTRLCEHGPSALTDGELVAILAGDGRRDARAAAACIALLRREGLERISRRSVREWTRVPGIGPAVARRVVAAFELRRRAAGKRRPRRPRIDGPRAAWRLVRQLARARREHLVGIYLDAQNCVVHRETLSIGSLNTTRTHPREILYPAVKHLALAFILAHNHPSGCPDPSTEDVEFTASIRRASELFGIELYDHLIVTLDGFTSLRERGLL